MILKKRLVKFENGLYFFYIYHYLDVRVPWLQVDLEFSNPRVDFVICCRIYIFHCRICIFVVGYHNYYYIIRPKNHCYYKMKNYYHKMNRLLTQKKLSTTKFFSLSTTKKIFFSKSIFRLIYNIHMKNFVIKKFRNVTIHWFQFHAQETKAH